MKITVELTDEQVEDLDRLCSEYFDHPDYYELTSILYNAIHYDYIVKVRNAMSSNS